MGNFLRKQEPNNSRHLGEYPVGTHPTDPYSMYSRRQSAPSGSYRDDSRKYMNDYDDFDMRDVRNAVPQRGPGKRVSFHGSVEHQQQEGKRSRDLPKPMKWSGYHPQEQFPETRQYTQTPKFYKASRNSSRHSLDAGYDRAEQQDVVYTSALSRIMRVFTRSKRTEISQRPDDLPPQDPFYEPYPYQPPPEPLITRPYDAPPPNRLRRTQSFDGYPDDVNYGRGGSWYR